MAINTEQPIVTQRVKGTGRRFSKYIPLDNLSCQYYRDIEIGDTTPNGHVVSQKDIDDGTYTQLGFNCASTDVYWMQDEVKFQEVFTDNPLFGIGDYEYDDSGDMVFSEPPGWLCTTPCWINGMGECFDCPSGGGGTGPGGGTGTGGGTGGTDPYPTPGCTNQYAENFNPLATHDDGSCTYSEDVQDRIQPNGIAQAVEKCCNAGTAHRDTDLTEQGNDENYGSYHACNRIDCGASEEDPYNTIPNGNNFPFAYVHQELQCVYPLGTIEVNGTELIQGNHNIVWNYYEKNASLASPSSGPPTEQMRHYPYFNRNTFADSDVEGKMYYSLPPVDAEDSYFNRPFTDSVENARIDKRQKGITKDGDVLYDLPTYVSNTCEDLQQSGADNPYLAVVRNPIFNIYGTQIGPQNGNDRGIVVCTTENNDLFNEFFNNPTLLSYVSEFFSTITNDKIRDFTGNIVTDAPSSQFGYGFGYFDDEAIEEVRNGTAPFLTPPASGVMLKEVLYRLGIPEPPLVIGYESDSGIPGHEQECYDNQVDQKYSLLLDEFKVFLEIGTFFADFGIPNVDIVPTMNGTLDVFSARDLREEKLNACDYVEFMTLPGGSTDGDGIYYQGNELDTEDTYLLNFDCNTEFNQNISGYSRMRAVCKDGSSVLIAGTGNNDNSVLNYDNADKRFNTGRDACNSKLKPYSNQDLYYLADGDLRESLGINFFESENTENITNNFTGNLTGEEFEQIQLPNLLLNGDGRLVRPNISWLSNEFSSDENVFDGVPYIPENWAPIQRKVGNSITLRALEERPFTDGDYETYNFQYTGMLPYWSSNNGQCFSEQKCLIIDTMNPSTYDISSDTKQFFESGKWDIRQAMTTWIPTKNISLDSLRKNSQYKVSFMMKTVDIKDDVDLKDTGIHVSAVFGNETRDWINQTTVGASPDVNMRNFNLRASGKNADEDNNEWPIVKFSNSQCSPNSHNEEHYSERLTNDDYCKKSKASFTNTEMDKWEKMEFTFTPSYLANISSTGNWFSSLMGGSSLIDGNGDYTTGLKLLFMPLQFALGGGGDFISDEIFDTAEENVFSDGSFEPDVNQIDRNGAKIYLDNFEFKEDFSFHPDVDVRKKIGGGEYGDTSLMRYSNSDDVQAPLQAQFYFYPRYSFDDVLSKERRILLEKFKFGQFYISDIDWGDGSPIEYSREPFQLGVEKILYHTYETNGVYEIQANMFQIKSDSYTYSFDNFDLLSYEGIRGITHTKKIRLKIHIGGGLSDDFKYFSRDGFSFIPYNNTLPIIGGVSNQSTYYKNIKRNIGILDDVNTTDIKYKSLTDRLNTEHALSKLDSSLDDRLNVLTNYRQPIINEQNTDGEYLNTLPIPYYFEEFNVVDNVQVNLSNLDRDAWEQLGRPDIADKIVNFINIQEFPSFATLEEKPFSLPIEFYYNPTYTQNNVWDGGVYNSFQSELGKSIGDCDLTNVKYYNEPKSIWELFGFENEDFDEIGVPNNPRYWKNIIPQDYSIFERDGLSENYVDVYSEQNWIGMNEYQNNYYYPVLPTHGADGSFTNKNPDSFTKIPFPLHGKITSENEKNEKLLINIINDKIDSDTFSDMSGNGNLGFIINDYKPLFDNESFSPKRTKFIDSIKTSESNGVF